MKLTLEDLVVLAEELALLQADGHLTLMRFSTGWKIMMGTPNLDSGKGREEVWGLKPYQNLKDALIATIKSFTIKRMI